MVTSQNLCGDTKCLIIDDDKLPKRVTKVIKNAIPKRVSFVPKSQTPISSQDVNQLNFAILVGQSLSVATYSKKPSKE